MKYGIFDDFWDNQPNHLPLMHLSINLDKTETFNLGKSIRLIDEIVAKNNKDKIITDTKFLFSDANWRPHLLGLMVILKLNKSEQSEFINTLWKRLCSGTWGCPQLLVVLSKIDPEFKIKSKRLLEENGFEQICKEILTEKEFSEKKFNHDITKNKILNATSYIINGFYDQTLEDDNGGSIAENWCNQLIEMNKLNIIKS